MKTPGKFALVAVSALALGTFALGGCWEREFANIPPNYIGLMLTPSGYDGGVYEPGQVDIGGVGPSRYGNRLVLIQRSGFAVKEQFMKGDPDNPRDTEDHRCVVGSRLEPMTLDTRLLLALPDYSTPAGKADLMRLALLGNPQGNNGRVMQLTALSIYLEQAKLQVRGKIREVCSTFESVEAVFRSVADPGESGFSQRIKKAVATALVESKVPLHLVDAVVSNVKPDPSVMDAIAAKQAAEKRVEAIEVITKFLGQDTDGSRRLVYRMQVLQEIMASGDKNGRSTVYMTDISGMQLPLPAVPPR
jgi:SPFH domain / Band 7 family